MTDRLIKPFLEITHEPQDEIKFLRSCQFDQICQNLTKEFHELNLECQLKNLDVINLPNIHLYVSVSIVKANLDGLNNISHPFNLKCSNEKVRCISKLLLPNVGKSSYLFEIDKETMKCEIKDLYVISLSEEELKEYYETLNIENLNIATARANSGSSESYSRSSSLNDDISNPQKDQCRDVEKNLITINMQTLRSMESNKELNKLRVKLQVVIHNLATNKLESYLTEPLFTKIIEDGIPFNKIKKVSDEQDSKNLKEKLIISNDLKKKNYIPTLANTSLNNLNNLRILRASRISGSINGGDELFLFCSYFDPNDIEVEFVQFKQDTEISWRALASLDRTDIHGNCSLIVKTPKYLKSAFIQDEIANMSSINKTKNNNILGHGKNGQNTGIKVYYRLFRPSTKEYSEKFVFYYFNDNLNEIRELFSENLLNESPLLNRLYKLYQPILKQYNLIENENEDNKSFQNEDFSLVKNILMKHLPGNHHLVKNIDSNFKYFEIINKLVNLNLNKKTAESTKKFMDDQCKDIDDKYNTIDEDNLIDISDTILDSSNLNYDKKSENCWSIDNNENKSKINDSESNIEHMPIKKKKMLNVMETSKASKRPITISNNSNKIRKENSKEQTSLQNSPKNIEYKEVEIQTNISISKNNNLSILEDLFSKDKNKKLLPLENQLRANLDSCISKMNALADRTGKALIKFAKTRSFHELLKTQRFLINVQDEEGNTPIHLCILFGNFDLLEIFVDVAMTIPDQNLINLKNHKNLTPLLLATYLEEIEVCKFLLEANADLAQTDIHGCNAIHIACKKRNANLLRTLIKHVDKNCNYGVINSINHDGYAPIHLAVMSQSVEIFQELLYLKQLKINIQDKRVGMTALHHASSKLNLYSIANLLVKNENIEIDVRAYNGCTPLHLSIANKNYLITCLLLNKGADLNIQSDIPLHCDTELFVISSKKDTLLRRTIEKVLNKLRENLKKNDASDKSSLSTNDSKLITDDASLKSKAINGDFFADQKTDEVSSVKNFIDINDVKLSQEIKKIFDSDLEKETLDDINDTKSKAILSQHNYDSLYYAQNDSWMLELFKCNKKMKRELFEKITIFEKFRKIYIDLQPFVDPSKINSNNLAKIAKLAQSKPYDFDKNKSIGKIKLSQQATSNDDEEMEIV